MTEAQKEQIRNLRNQGNSYSEISSALCIPKSTIKSYCNRNPIREGIKQEAKRPFSVPDTSRYTGKRASLKPVHMVKEPDHIIQSPVPCPDDGHCRCCGEPMGHIPGRRKRFFCSEECRRKWWTEHPEASGGKALYSFTCQACGKEFTVYGNQSRKYCSHPCYIQARFKKGL